MAHSHENVGGCSRSSCPFTCLTVFWLTVYCSGGAWMEGWRCEDIIRCSGKLQRYKQYLRNNIYVSRSVFVKIAHESNMNIYRLAAYPRH